MTVALIALILPLMAERASADTVDTHTKIETRSEIKTIAFENDPFLMNTALQREEAQEKEETKTPEEIKYEAIMTKWKTKQKLMWEKLPDGTFTINASAYTASADECGKSDGITASGIKVAEKRTLACPPNYPFGTKISIEGMGIYTCEDRGGAIKGNKFDIYMQTKTEAFQFGRRNLLAQVVQ